MAAPPEYAEQVAREDERLDALDVAALAAIGAALESERRALAADLQARAKSLPKSAGGLVTKSYTAQVIKAQERSAERLSTAVERLLAQRVALYSSQASRDAFTELGLGVTPAYRAKLKALRGELYGLTAKGGYSVPVERAFADLARRVEDEARKAAVRRAEAIWLAERIAGKEGALTLSRGRLDLIMRMEASAAYAETHQSALRLAAQSLGDTGLSRRAYELRDKRNHPLSVVLDGQVTGLDEPWKVSVADVYRAAARLKKAPTGVIWPVKGAYFVGSEYPAHYNERGRQTLWRSQWG